MKAPLDKKDDILSLCELMMPFEKNGLAIGVPMKSQLHQMGGDA